MAMQKGIVSKISEKNCIVLTTTGEFRKVPLPKIPVRVGQEIECPTETKSWWNRFALVAAALLIALLGLAQFQLTVTATPVAFVTLDINPSMELAVDKNQRVIQITSLNEDTPKLLTNVNYQGQDLYQVVSQIIQQAVALNYVTSNKANLVVTTIVELNQQTKLNITSLQNAVETPLKDKPLKTKIVCLKAKNTDRDNALKIKLSTGKYLIYQTMQQPTNPPSLAEVKDKSIANLVQAKKIKLPEPTEDVRIKLINGEDNDEDRENNLKTTAVQDKDNDKTTEKDLSKKPKTQPQEPKPGKYPKPTPQEKQEQKDQEEKQNQRKLSKEQAGEQTKTSDAPKTKNEKVIEHKINASDD